MSNEDPEALAKIKAHLQTLIAHDRERYDKLVARVGQEKATVISSLANLSQYVPVFPLAMPDVSRLLANLPKVFGMTETEFLDEISMFIHGRRFSSTPEGRAAMHESTKQNLNIN